MLSFLPKPPSPILQRGDPLARGLVGAWVFSEGAGGSINDLSGSLNTGTFATGAWAAGPFGTSAKFDGGNTSYVMLVRSPRPDWTKPWTIGCVLSVATVAATQAGFSFRLVAFHDGTTPAVLYLDDITGHACWTNGVTSIGHNTVFTDNATEHFFVTFDGTSHLVYLNAVENHAYTGGVPGTVIVNLIGARSPSPSQAGMWPGTVNKVVVYNRALSAAEIAQDYQDPFRIYRPRSRLWEYAVSAPVVAAIPRIFVDA